MSLAFAVVNWSIKNLTRLLCNIEDGQLERIPQQGPLILVSNHINFLEVPLMYTHLLPRPVTGFAKAETWNNPAMALLFDLWGAIPLRRGQPDKTAMRRALQALKEGKVLGIAPEGTRSGDGRLGRGKPGVAMLALSSGAPLLPVAFFGGEALTENLSRLKRTDFRIVVGDPFEVVTPSARITHGLRQSIADEIMYQLASLLPPEYRGAYADLSRATEQHLRFSPPSQSNLLRAHSPLQEPKPAGKSAG